MNKFAKTLIAGAVMATSSVALAEVSGNVALSSDYMFRGVSQTDNQMSLSGGFDYSHASGFYVGTWASNIDSNFFSGTSTDPQLEADLYVGYGGEMANGVGYDVGIIRYNYPGFDQANTTEIYANGTYGVSDAVTLNAGFAYSNELAFVGSKESAYYLSVGADVALPEDFALAVKIGQSDGDAFDPAKATGYPSSYMDYSIGVSKEFGGVGFDLTYIDTNDDAEKDFGSSVTDGRVVFTISKSM